MSLIINRLVYLLATVLLTTLTSHHNMRADALPIDSDPILVGAGDIASCELKADEATAKLLDDIPGAVFTLGDNAYPNGTAAEFSKCYESSWGRHKARTFPTPGNHDYITANGGAYYDYFGTKAGAENLGYYSFDLGEWHIIALNSNIAAQAGSAQEKWLRADLQANEAVCTLAYWHHPRFSSGEHKNSLRMRDVWRVLYEYGADVVLSGHDHDYERFAPQDPNGNLDVVQGIREFVVGTGGGGLRPFTTIQPNSEVRNSDTWGVLKLTLHPTGYEWEFIPVPGKTFRDAGAATCVGAPTGAVILNPVESVLYE